MRGWRDVRQEGVLIGRAVFPRDECLEVLKGRGQGDGLLGALRAAGTRVCVFLSLPSCHM